jgi:CRP-like cAMP-binding protein
LICVNARPADRQTILAMQQVLHSSVQVPIGPVRDGRLLEGVISKLPLFRQLSRAQLDMLVGHSQLHESRRGAAIVRRGTRMPGVIALAYGSAKVSLRRANGEEKVVRLLGPGEIFGLAAALLDRPCPVELVALQNSLVATVPPMPVLHLMEQDLRFAGRTARALAERMLELVAELEASVQQSSLQRLARYLDSLAVPNGQPGSWLARLPATKTTVAALLGVKKETLSRMLRELATRNLIAVAGAEVAIVDRPGLARLASPAD